jgi:catechol 2,3-dioxygenase-like lactoylglutathione lyase family enzyme
MSNFSAISPLFIVSNLEGSVSFYVDKLGFKVWYSSPAENPFFAIVGRDDISIMLKAIAEDIKPIPNNTRHKWARWDAFIYTEEPDALFEEYYLADITFHQTLQDDDDGLRGFEVADADGYVLFFGRPKIN